MKVRLGLVLLGFNNILCKSSFKAANAFTESFIYSAYLKVISSAEIVVSFWSCAVDGEKEKNQVQKIALIVQQKMTKFDLLKNVQSH